MNIEMPNSSHKCYVEEPQEHQLELPFMRVRARPLYKQSPPLSIVIADERRRLLGTIDQRRNSFAEETRAATHPDDLDAVCRLSNSLLQSDEEREREEAHTLLWIAARRGHPEAGYNLGFRIYSGEVPICEPSACVYWFLKAAQGGDVCARFILGCLYRDGEHVHKSCTKALLHLSRAAMLHHPDAMAEIARICRDNEVSLAAKLHALSLLRSSPVFGYEFDEQTLQQTFFGQSNRFDN
jgi:hypothetical protein